MALEPKPGLVIRYDFLWKDEADRGQEQGNKDRPCAIVLATQPKPDGSRHVILCPITHSPPSQDQSAVEVPPKVARHLGLDSDRNWIKTDQINTVVWPKARMPFGIAPLENQQWTYGQLPQALGRNVLEQVRERSQSRSLENVRREDYEDYLQERAKAVEREERDTKGDDRDRDNDRER